MSGPLDPERFAEIERLFYDALGQPLAKRSDFLEACGRRDPSLRDELESLLARAESPATRVDALPGLVAADWIRCTEEDRAGETIGHYRLRALIGRGGGGDVYLAHDTVLERPAALKLLRDPDSGSRRRRIEEEARAASALNHPNIVTIHEIGMVDGQPFIVTEFIDGETLRARLAGGALPIADVLSIAIQIAAALDAAHAAGLVHRDVKPENIMLRRDGYAKLLDFGLATPVYTPDVPAADSSSRSSSTPAALGTIAYMSPEQAQGLPLDRRTDVFSLGVVIYEMVTGRRPFGGDTHADSRRATIEAPHGSVRSISGAPPSLAEAIDRALAKNPALRCQTAADLLTDLERVRREIERRPARRVVRDPRAWTVAAIAAVVVMLAGVVMRPRALHRPERNAGFRFLKVTDEAGPELFPTLSPDGRLCVYAGLTDGHFDLYVKPVDGGAAVNLTKGSGADNTAPAFSPDGRQLAFVSDRDARPGTYLMDLSSRHVRYVTELRGNPSWMPDGESLLVGVEPIEDPSNRMLPLSQVSRVNLIDGAAKLVVDTDAVQPQASPHGRRVAYWTTHGNGRRDIWTAPLDGVGAATRVTDDPFLNWNPVWSHDGRHLFFISDRGGSMNVWRVAIDEASGAPRSAPEPIVAPAAYTKHLTVARDGGRLAFVQASISAVIRKAKFDPVAGAVVGPIDRVVERSTRAVDPSVSPDGEWLAFSSEGDLREDIFVVRTDGTSLRQLTNDDFKDRAPAWSPDGTQLAFYSNRGGAYDIWTIDRDGRGLRQHTRAGSGVTLSMPLWMRDGRRLLYHGYRTTCTLDFDAPRQEPACEPRVTVPDSGFTAWSWSPDGRRVAGWLNTSNRFSVMTYEFSTHAYQALASPGMFPSWLPDGRRLLYSANGRLYLLDEASRASRVVLSNADIGSFRLSPDGRVLYFTSIQQQGDIWVIEPDERR